jgi:hypothetical protein
MIGTPLERQIEGWPRGTDDLGQAVLRKANVQASQRIDTFAT